MKLASIRDGSRDGRLVVVSRDVTQASDARHIAPTLQAALDDWDRLAPHLDLVARGVESGGQPVERFHEREAMAPLPRAYRLMEAGAPCANAPLLRLRGSDGFAGPRDPIRLADDETGLEIGAAIAVVLGDVPIGADRATALAAIRLVMLMSTVALQRLSDDGDDGDDAAGPAATFSPVAVTPDELGAEWDGAQLRGALLLEVNGRPIGRRDEGAGMAADFGDLIVRAARHRPLGAGAIVGSGPVTVGGGDGAACPSLLGMGDTLRIEMRDATGHAIFGAIETQVEPFRRN